MSRKPIPAVPAIKVKAADPAQPTLAELLIRDTAAGARTIAAEKHFPAVVIANRDFKEELSLKLCYIRAMLDIMTVVTCSRGLTEELDHGSLGDFCYHVKDMLVDVKAMVDGDGFEQVGLT